MYHLAMRCWNCHEHNKNTSYNYEHCSKCGLYTEILTTEQKYDVVSVLENMTKKWEPENTISFYEKSDVGIEFNYKGIVEITTKIFKDEDISIGELNALIKVISYLSKEFETNVTDTAINIFWFANDFFNSHKDHLRYWIKRGLKQNSRKAYEYLLCDMCSSTDKRRRNKRKIEKLRNTMRNLQNY